MSENIASNKDSSSPLSLHKPFSALPTKIDPPFRPSSPGVLAQDFARQQIQKQQNNNFHSTSLKMVAPQSVNKTALHPGGVEYVLLFPS